MQAGDEPEERVQGVVDRDLASWAAKAIREGTMRPWSSLCFVGKIECAFSHLYHRPVGLQHRDPFHDVNRARHGRQ